MKIKIVEWKKFKLKDLFTANRGHTLTVEYRDLYKGAIPCINGSAENNGVLCYLSKDLIKEGFALQGVPSLSLSRVGNSGQTFLQTKPYFIADNAFSLTLKTKQSKEVYLFLSTVLNAEKFKYSYGRTISIKKYLQTEINLPAINNNPDWVFMGNYIKSLRSKPIVSNNQDYKKNLNVTEWKEFQIGKLFELKKCKCGNAGALEDGNDVFYIGAKKDDNGIMKSVNLDKSLLSKGNCIIFICDGQGSVGYTNYIEKDFIGSTTLTAGYNSNLNKYNALFIVSVLDKERYKYSYGRKYGPHLENSVIKLPTKNNQPDWKFMEDYIKSLPYADRI